MIKVQTYFFKSEQFVIADRFEGTLEGAVDVQDQDFWGSIDLEVDGSKLLIKSNVDFVDQLWLNLLYDLCDVALGIHALSYYPGLAIEFMFIVMNDSQMEIRITANGNVTKAYVETREFLGVMIREAEKFFLHAAKCCKEGDFSVPFNLIDGLKKNDKANLLRLVGRDFGIGRNRAE